MTLTLTSLSFLKDHRSLDYVNLIIFIQCQCQCQSRIFSVAKIAKLLRRPRGRSVIKAHTIS